MWKKAGLVSLLLTGMLTLSSCAGSAQSAPAPTPDGARLQAQQSGVRWPKDKLTIGEGGTPMVDVYVVDDQAVQNMDVETYVQGVLAGEMKNDWPMEALKAQAILARTFVLKFIQDKNSKYPGADISTDIEEAQAYSAADVNDRIRQAVDETRGLVMVSDGELPYAWFHAHSGGMTELAVTGLGWDKAEPSYTQVVKSPEPDTADDAQALRDAQNWAASFPIEELETALSSLGKRIELSDSSVLTISEHGDSGRAKTIEVDGQSVGAAELRIALGSTKMRSTLISSLSIKNSTVYMAGKGYGHGVGMSQWGAYGMAQQGRSAADIVRHYFRNITIEKLW